MRSSLCAWRWPPRHGSRHRTPSSASLQPPLRILVVEDNAKLAGHLRRGLAESGYVVDVATDGIDGRHMAIEGNYDLVLLDVMLPTISGASCSTSR